LEIMETIGMTAADLATLGAGIAFGIAYAVARAAWDWRR
jgi:hypothetical protein